MTGRKARQRNTETIRLLRIRSIRGKWSDSGTIVGRIVEHREKLTKRMRSEKKFTRFRVNNREEKTRRFSEVTSGFRNSGTEENRNKSRSCFPSFREVRIFRKR